MSELTPQDPTRIGGRYDVVQKLGAGAFGTVYKAKDSVLGRMVAIKTIRLEGLAAQGIGLTELVDRFRREALVSAKLKHPNIVTIYDVGESEGMHFLAMEFIDGRGLERVLSDAGRLDPVRAAHIVAQMVDALGFAHEQGVIHRDVKPANVMMEPQDRVKVTDFGIAKAMDAVESLTVTGTLLGTPSYMSPEQARGQGLDGRSDIFSAGAVLYELLTGQKAFKGPSITGLIFKILTEEPTPVRELDPDVPDELVRIIAKALAKDPAKRYQTGHEMAEDLNAFSRGVPTQRVAARAEMPPPTINLPPTPPPLPPGTLGGPAAPPPPPRSVVPSPPPRPVPPRPAAGGGGTVVKVLLAVGVVGLLVVAAAGYVVWRMFQGPTTPPSTSLAAVTLPPQTVPPATTGHETPPPASLPPATAPVGMPPPVTQAPLTAPPATAPPGTAPPATSPRGASVLDEEPQIDGRAAGEHLAEVYGSGQKSSYGAKGHFRPRDRYPKDTSAAERPAVMALLNVYVAEEKHKARAGRYGRIPELGIPFDVPVTPTGFTRRGYRFELTLDADSFQLTATPSDLSNRTFLVDDSGFVRVPD